MNTEHKQILIIGLILSLIFTLTAGVLILAKKPHTKPIIFSTETYTAAAPSMPTRHVKDDTALAKISKNEFIKSMSDPMEIDRSKYYTKREVQCLARNIYFEAQNQSILGQYYVAWVTMNRVEHKKWPSNVCSVVWQRHQFSWTHDGKSDRPKNKQVYAIAKMIAEDTLYDARTGADDLSKGALYYHAKYVEPYWNKNLVKLSQIDSHIFYKEPL